MLNMSSPFYKLVADQLSSYFKKEAIQNVVNRYYLALPSETHVQNIIAALEQLDEVKPFTCEIAQYDTYETIALTYGKQKYVIASTLDNTHIDFLVTLRNLMSEQKGPWENTSLIIITENTLDSIQGGSKDLTSEGMPLHVSQMVKDLGKLIEKSNLTKSNIELLKHYLNEREDIQIVHKTSFIDFEDILSWAFKETITKEDYYALGYFKDSELDKMIDERDQHMQGSSKYKATQKEIDQRLNLNADIFEEVARLRELGNGEERLVDMYDNCGKDLFKGEKEIELKQIIKAQEKVSDRKKIVFKADQITIDRLWDGQKVKSFWQKNPKGRTYDLIVFQPDYKAGNILEIRLPFSRKTSESYVTKNKDKLVSAKEDSLIVKLPLDAGNYTYKSVAYRHENLTSSLFTFRIVVVKEEESWLKSHELTYAISKTGDLKIKLDDESVVFGDGNEAIVVEAADQHIETAGTGLKLSFVPGLLDDDSNSLKFKVTHNDCTIGIEISDEVLRTIPIDAESIWNKKMKACESFYFDDDEKKINIGQNPFVTYEKDRKFFKLEKRWMQKHLYYAKYEMNTLTELDIKIPAEVLQAYDAFLTVLKSKKTIPSFVFYDEEVREVAEKYIVSFINVVENIKENEIMSDEQRGVLYLGALEMGDTLYMTPFSPMNVAYQLEITKEVAGQIIDTNTLKRLKASYMLPYLVNPSDQILKSDSLNSLVEWHSYKPQTQVSVGETNNYLAQVIREKITQFNSYYEYLFTLTNKPKILINIINISNDKELLRGILQWYKDAINQSGSLEDLLSVRVRSYVADVHLASAFEQFNETSDPELVKELFNFDCTTKLHHPIDVLQQIQKHLSFSKLSIEETPEYSHLTFYKMQNSESNSKQIVQQVPNSLGLNGLYISTTSKRTEKAGYRIGFGIGDSNANRSLLTKFAKLLNELSANRTNGGNDPYMKEIAYSLHIKQDDEEYLNKLYQCTTWLTFIDPAVDLEYFQDTSSDLVIVHYSDQLSSSNRYDAITVTNKSQQYYKVIDEFLRAQGIEVRAESIEHIIKSFNTFNGEWLLRAVQNRAHDKREKMSIVAAIKHALKIFDKPAIQWVPVSMEEIVRVAGNIRLNKKDGLFSGKTIGRKGNCSDDLMLIGIERGQSRLKMYLYPIEVKIGHNSQEVIQKGIRQVIELKNRLDEYLLAEDSFDAKFLRNFFARMFIINANKMEQNQFWPERSFKIENGTEEALLNDDFDISNDLIAEFGIGSIFSFKKQLQQSSNCRHQDILVHEIPEDVAYQSIGISMNNLMANNFEEMKVIPIIEMIAEENVDELPEFVDEALDSSSDEDVKGKKNKQSKDEEPKDKERITDSEQVAKGDVTSSHTREGSQSHPTDVNAQKDESGPAETANSTVIFNPDQSEIDNILSGAKQEEDDTSKTPVVSEKSNNKEIDVVEEVTINVETSIDDSRTETAIVEGNTINSDIEILLGNINNGTKDIYWNHSRKISDPLSNHNIIITGDPGKGKTQSIKGIVHDIRANNIPIMLMDFKDDYIDKDFLENENIKMFDVMENGLPFNPLIPSIDKENNSFIAVGHIIQLEGILKRIYGLGDQQAYLLRSAMRKAFELKGINPSKSVPYSDEIEFPTFNNVFDILNEDYKKHATLIGRLDLLFQIGLFPEKPEVNFEQLLESSYTLRLTKLPTDEIKSAVAEILILAMHNYFSSKEHPRKLTRGIVLDEAHRISKSEILATFARECRAFGISIIIATQFPTDMSEDIYGCTETKLFLGNDDPKHARAAAEKIVGTANKDELLKMSENIRGFKQFQAVIRNIHYMNDIINILPYYKKIN